MKSTPELEGSWLVAHHYKGCHFNNSLGLSLVVSYSRQEGGRNGTGLTHWPELYYMATASTRDLGGASL